MKTSVGQGQQSSIYFGKTTVKDNRSLTIIGSKFASQRAVKTKNKCESYLKLQTEAYFCVLHIHILAGRMKIS